MPATTESFVIQNNSCSKVYFTVVTTKDRLMVFDKIDYYENDILNGTISISMGYFFYQPDKDFIRPNNTLELLSIFKMPQIGALSKFKSCFKEFNIYDGEGNLFLTIEDLREGTVTVYRGRDGNLISRKEQEGNIKIVYHGEPESLFTNAIYTIEIMDELIMKGREKYKNLPRLAY
jgi:hypothetical protein